MENWSAKLNWFERWNILQSLLWKRSSTLRWHTYFTMLWQDWLMKFKTFCGRQPVILFWKWTVSWSRIFHQFSFQNHRRWFELRLKWLVVPVEENDAKDMSSNAIFWKPYKVEDFSLLSFFSFYPASISLMGVKKPVC